VDNLMAWPGAHLRAVDVKEKGDDGAWMRYMQDHASKSKQEQIAIGIGRQWGVIGRKHFVKCVPEFVERLTDLERDKFLRCLQRLATPHVYEPRVFPINYIEGLTDVGGVSRSKKDRLAWKLGRRPLRGHIGKSVWFEEPAKLAAVRRIIAWVKRPQ